MAVSVVSVAYNVAAAALLAPLAATTAFILAIETVTDRRFYVALDLALAVLPDDPDRAACSDAKQPVIPREASH